MNLKFVLLKAKDKTKPSPVISFTYIHIFILCFFLTRFLKTTACVYGANMTRLQKPAVEVVVIGSTKL